MKDSKTENVHFVSSDGGQLVFRVDIHDSQLKTSVSVMMTRRSPMWSAIVMAKVMSHIAGMFDLPPEELYKMIGESLISEHLTLKN